MRRKDSRSTYIIYALVCLIVFNAGTMLIRQSSDKAEPVFSLERHYFNNKNIFIPFISKTSSIMNLHRRQFYNENPERSFQNGSSIANNIINYLKARFPSILLLGAESMNHGDGDAENDIENHPVEVEDFIIIDRLDEYEDLIIIKDSQGNIMISDILKPLNIDLLEFNKEKPYVLIYHTHGTESYSSLTNNEHHTENKKLNVIGIGELLADTMREKGHRIEHITKYHDMPSYSKSYTESLKTINKMIDGNNNLKILLDIHRDGHDHNDPKVIKNLKNLIKKFKINIDDKEVATFYFVIGPDSPNKEAVLNFAKYIKAVSDVLYPGICTGIMIKPIGKYNQFVSDYSALIELGCNLNTIEEAQETARILGDILSIAIDNLQK